MEPKDSLIHQLEGLSGVNLFIICKDIVSRLDDEQLEKITNYCLEEERMRKMVFAEELRRIRSVPNVRG